jgi:hypothetical protein
MYNMCAKFHQNPCINLGGVGDTNLCLQTDGQTDRQTDSSIPPLTSLRGYKKRVRNKTKLHNYQQQERLFTKDRKALATLILDEKGKAGGCPVEPSSIEETYMGRFGGESQEVDLTAYPLTKPMAYTSLLKPFIPRGIKRSLKKMKKNTAPGPDEVDIKEIIEDTYSVTSSIYSW